MLAPLATSACSIRSTTDSLLTTEYLLKLAPTGSSCDLLHEVSRGALDATVVRPRELFRGAIVANAAVTVRAYNHASGHRKSPILILLDGPYR
jgi:hypothetical protein